LAKVCFAGGASEVRTWDAVRQAVEIYPPYLTDLLAIGLNALERAGRGSEASLLAKQWAYFITRVDWVGGKSHPVADQTWQAAEGYADAFPRALRDAFQRKKMALS
jgi:hypothetical protein